MLTEARRTYLREYQRKWIMRRRNEWIKDHGPCAHCGSHKELEVDHRNAATKKLPVTALWSLSPSNPKRVKELAKCWVLCKTCHKRKTLEDREYARGEANGQSKWTAGQVYTMRVLRAKGLTYAQIGARFGTGRQNVWEVCNKTWKHL